MALSTMDTVFLLTESIIGILSVCGNSLVILAVWRFRSMRTSTNYLIASLAAADVFVGLFVPASSMTTQLGLPRNVPGCVALNSIAILITNISVLTLLIVALDRFVAIKFPFFYHSMMTGKRALIIVAVTWAIGIIIGFIPNMGWHKHPKNFTACSFPAVIDRRYMVYLIFFGITLPTFIAMLIIYIYIFHIIWKQQQQMKTQMQHLITNNVQRTLQKQQRNWRGTLGLAYVIILFVVCWIPIYMVNVLSVMANIETPIEWILVAVALSHANSVLNPFLYGFANSKFKLAMAYFITCGKMENIKAQLTGVSTSHHSAKDSSVSTNVSPMPNYTNLQMRKLNIPRPVNSSQTHESKGLDNIQRNQRIKSAISSNASEVKETLPPKTPELVHSQVPATEDKKQPEILLTEEVDGQALKFDVNHQAEIKTNQISEGKLEMQHIQMTQQFSIVSKSSSSSTSMSSGSSDASSLIHK